MTMLMPLSSDFGQCPCSGTYESILVDVNMTVGAEQVHLTGISQGRCPKCGGRVYKAGVLEELESLLRGEQPPRRHGSTGL